MSEIIVSGLFKQYDSKKTFSVKDLSLSIHKGTVFGFLGPNGAGKTTTMKMLVGLTFPTKGTIRIGEGTPHDIRMREKIGFMPEAPSFYQYLTGREFLTFIAGIFNIKNEKEVVTNILEEVDLLHAADAHIRTYSKGMLQRLGLAQSLINDPEILFLDEPLDGLDPLGRAQIKKIILALKERKRTIFFNSHIIADVEEICDSVGIIDRGTLIAVGSPQELANGYKDLEDAFVNIITNSREQQ